MRVLKFGGTSLATAHRMRGVADIVKANQPCLVVVSALAGTTDSLVQLTEFLAAKQLQQAEVLVEELKAHYRRYINNLFKLEEFRERAIKFIDEQFAELEHCLTLAFVPALGGHILAKGELISSELFHILLSEQGCDSILLNALEFLRLTRDGEPDQEFLEASCRRIFEHINEGSIYITQGFICRDAFGEVSNLKRGGSDYTASLFAAAVGAEELQIWTDIDGMHNNDPRYVENTHPIRRLSFDEAAELAYFGAKILHPASIKPARKANIPVRLLNTMQPELPGTIISKASTIERVKAIAAKSGITAIKIRSSEMLQAPGFLRRVFEVFELYKTSIDTVTTSEVAVSLTIDDTTRINEIRESLSEYGKVEIDNDLCIICVVGDFVANRRGLVARVTEALKEIPIRMISYGGSEHNITFLISDQFKREALNILHQELFCE